MEVKLAAVASIPKRPGKEIRLSIEEFNGQTQVNTRVRWQDDFDEWKRRKQGISLTPAQFRAIAVEIPGILDNLTEAGL